MSDISKRFLFAFLVLIFIIAIGTFGFWIISEKQSSIVDCLYMTFITITTIGYGEIINLHNNSAGRIFTMIIAISGIGTFTFILTNFTAFVIGGELFKNYKERRMFKMISKFSNHFIICGSGDIGVQIANELFSTQRQYVIVDKSEPDLFNFFEKDIVFIKGDATDEPTLEKAGINKARGIFAVTGDDNYNLVITFTAKHLNQSLRIVSKCRDINHIDKLKKAGADAVISPTLIGGLRIVSEMIRPTVVSFLDTMLRDKEKNLRIEEFVVPENYDNKTIAEINIRDKFNSLILAIKENEHWRFNPAGDTKLKKGEILILMISSENRTSLEKLFLTNY